MGARRRRLGEAGWRSLLGLFAGSGLTIAAFCRQQGVSEASFHRWRAQLGEVTVGANAVAERPPGAAAFVDLGTLAGRVPGGGFDLRLALGDGLVLQLTRH